ncbi:MAG TPA: protein translocase subunit SecF [Thermoanaerobaculia bacterium]|jgi:preprotein translocase subunit SecF|nr:protein translocase subunit SecF [Thermoanaerobaculia bacterium]
MKNINKLNIDFMRHRHIAVAISAALVLFSLVEIFFLARLNMGIDFAGGTQLIVRFLQPTEIDEVRGVLAGAGLGEVQIQRYGDEKRNEILIKTPLVAEHHEGSRDLVERALEARYGKGDNRPDLNQIGVATLSDVLYAADPDHQLASGETAAREHYRVIAERVMLARRDRGLFGSSEELASVEGLSPEARAVLGDRTSLGTFSIVSAENVGPTIGRELRTRGVLAVVLSLLGMMAYIWWRFEFRFGAGAMIASAHDVIVTLGVYALLGYEFNLTTIAAFLTLVGYSVNDTVVIFDRVRENMRKPKRLPLTQVINEGINETLSRTIMTASTTLLAVLALFLVGGEVLRGLSFVLLFGIIVGTYSTIYIASAMVLFWEGRQAAGETAKPAAAKASPTASTAPRPKASPRRSSI